MQAGACTRTVPHVDPTQLAWGSISGGPFGIVGRPPPVRHGLPSRGGGTAGWSLLIVSRPRRALMQRACVGCIAGALERGPETDLLDCSHAHVDDTLERT